jgi:outer membrane protein assembly factor BamD
MKKFFQIVLFFSLIILASCGGYEKLLKSSDYQLKFDKAFEYYEKEDYVRAATLFEQIANVYRGTVKADTLQFYRAMSYYHQRDYLMASHYFSELAETYPNSGYTEEASYMTGYCYYKLSPRPSLDQEYTRKAVNSFTLFRINYPQSPRIDEAAKIVRELQDKIVEKSYLNAKLYFDLGYYKAALVALRNSLGEYPGTSYREQLMYLILRASYLLADNSVESKKKERFQATVDEYYSFIGEFPNGEFSDDAKRMYEESMRELGQEIN